jgi:hypothetical protein
MLVKISTDLAAPASVVWQAVKQTVTLLHVIRVIIGLSTAEALPKQWEVGDIRRVRLVFFHLIPAWQHEIRIARIDETQRELGTEEAGGPVEMWNHRIRVEPRGERVSRYTDEVEIRAGWLTAPVWLFAQLFYRYRQWRWRALARKLASSIAVQQGLADTIVL